MMSVMYEVNVVTDNLIWSTKGCKKNVSTYISFVEGLIAQ